MNIDRFIKSILLTGAGFTRDFGGLLASELADFIYNSEHLKNFPELKEELQTIRNFEDFYQKILNGNYGETQEKAVRDAIFEAYDKIDKKLCEWAYLTNDDVHINGLADLLRLFAGEANQCGAFFTLNQDLFVERHISGNVHIELPCVSRVPRRRYPLESSDYETLPNSEKLNELLNGEIHPLNTGSRVLYYIKLHGSHNWLSSDGSRRMVIGPDKEGQINREPLLKWYKEDIFPTLVNRNGVKLLVIGYSFGDAHINSVIAQAKENKEIELCVVAPTQRVEFTERLKNAPCGEILARRLDKYYKSDLKGIFPGDQRPTDVFQAIRRWLFP